MFHKSCVFFLTITAFVALFSGAARAADTTPPHTVLVLDPPTASLTFLPAPELSDGFEEGLSDWTCSGTVAISTVDPHTYAQCAKIGPGTGSMYQSVSVSLTPETAFLTFWYKAAAYTTAGCGCRIQDTSGNTLVYPLACTSSQSTWKEVKVDLMRFAGQTVRLSFYSLSNGMLHPTLYVDDVVVWEHERVYVGPYTPLLLRAYDPSGINFSQRRFDSGSWITYGGAFDLSSLSEGSHTVGYRSWDHAGNLENATTCTLYLDKTAPYDVLTMSGPKWFNGGTEKITNGNFDTSGLDGWYLYGSTVLDPVAPMSAPYSLKLGPGLSGAVQFISISGACSNAFLSFCYHGSHFSGSAFSCEIWDESSNLLVRPLFESVGSNGPWRCLTVDLSRFKGMTVGIVFRTMGGADSQSIMWIDDVSVRENAAVWVGGATEIGLTGDGDIAGVNVIQYKIDSGSWTTFTDPFTLASYPIGDRTIQHQSQDNFANTGAIITSSIYSDPDAPLAVLRIGEPRVFTGGASKATNGTFERGLDGWTTVGAVTTVSSPVHGGRTAAEVGATGGGALYQDVAVSSSASRALASVWIKTASSTGTTNALVALVDPVSGMTVDSYSVPNTSFDWMQYVWDIAGFKGASVRLRFSVAIGDGTPMTLYVDDVEVLEDAELSVQPFSLLKIRAADLLAVSGISRSVDGGGFVDGNEFSISGNGLHDVSYRAEDLLEQLQTVSTQIRVDLSGPTGSFAINGGAPYCTGATVTLNVSASDPSGIALNENEEHGCMYGSWQAYQSSASWTLTAGSGTKTVYMQLQDAFGNTSDEMSDSIEYNVATSMPTIGQMKLQAFPAAYYVSSKVVTGIFPALACAYIEESDRASGIRINTATLSPALSEGQSGRFTGVLQLGDDSEPELYLTAFQSGGSGTAAAPMGMSCRGAGGGAWGGFPAVSGGMGLHSIGLLVRMWGLVTWRSEDMTRIRVDDGSGGILTDTTLYGTAPAPGATVVVTGDLGATIDGGVSVPIIRIRKPADLSLF